MKREYLAEIGFALLAILLISYMIFTWKQMKPELEPAATVEAAVVGHIRRVYGE